LARATHNRETTRDKELTARLAELDTQLSEVASDLARNMEVLQEKERALQVAAPTPPTQMIHY
jgi:hypothetical protein